MSEESFILDSKKSLPNKLLQDDGTVTDITGAPVGVTVDAYENKPALPNKFLNPDGTYSTLNEIIASMVDTSIYVIVDELPAEGNPQKIYIVPNGDGNFNEYRWTGTKWDSIGMLEFDITNYSTTAEMNAAIATALQAAKDYADGLASNYDPAGAASTAETNAKGYADTKKAEAVASANTYTDSAIQSSITDVLGGSY